MRIQPIDLIARRNAQMGINMNDVYVECLIKAKPSGAGRFFKGLLIVLTVLFVMAMFILGPAMLLLALITGAGAYFVNMFTDLEYEYLYLDKELTVDKVMAKTRRKRVAAYSLDRMEAFGPVKSYHLDSYRGRQNLKVKDYSIGVEEKPDLRYAMYYEGGEMILFSPSSELVKAMKNASPRKVFTD